MRARRRKTSSQPISLNLSRRPRLLAETWLSGGDHKLLQRPALPCWSYETKKTSVFGIHANNAKGAKGGQSAYAHHVYAVGCFDRSFILMKARGIVVGANVDENLDHLKVS